VRTHSAECRASGLLPFSVSNFPFFSGSGQQEVAASPRTSLLLSFLPPGFGEQVGINSRPDSIRDLSLSPPFLFHFLCRWRLEHCALNAFFSLFPPFPPFLSLKEKRGSPAKKVFHHSLLSQADIGELSSRQQVHLPIPGFFSFSLSFLFAGRREPHREHAEGTGIHPLTLFFFFFPIGTPAARPPRARVYCAAVNVQLRFHSALLFFFSNVARRGCQLRFCFLSLPFLKLKPAREGEKYRKESTFFSLFPLHNEGRESSSL